jgi:NADPH-dependent ferric siderophore reductase
MSTGRTRPDVLRTFTTSVAAVEEVHTQLRRVTFEGGQLAAFEPVGPDTFVYLLVAPPGCEHLEVDDDFTWERHFALPDETRPVGAYYTVRRWDPARLRLEILMVLHGDEGSGSAWAQRAEVGERVALWGPRTAYEPPADTDRWLLVADETGLPAVAAILEQLPVGQAATVLAEADGAATRQALPARPGVDVRWLHRDGAPAGTTTLLADAVRAVPPPGPTTYVWGGAESRAMTAVRKHVRHEVGLPRERVSLVSYWRHPESPVEVVDDEADG